VLSVVLFHRVFWPTLGRLIYAAYEWRVFADRKLQLTSAVVFLSYGFGITASIKDMILHK
jgi:hypothetical protein